MDGLGPVMPALTTGAVAAAPPVALTPSVDATDSRVFLNTSTLSVPGAITGVAQLQLQLPKGLPAGPYLVVPTLDGTPLRVRLMLVWTRPD